MEPTSPPDAARRPKVTVVDDDRHVRETLAEFLSDEGFEVDVAPNGLRLVSALQVDRPDVILLDVVMSWIDGLELCRALKRNPQFRPIPIVIISGHTDTVDVERGLHAGATAYFPKPLDLEALSTFLRDLAADPDA